MAGEESLAAWSRTVQMQVHHVIVHTAAHLPLKAAHHLGFRPLLLQLLEMGRAGSLR